MMMITNFPSTVELHEVMKVYQKQYGNDLGLMIVAMHLAHAERIASLEATVRELQTAKKR